MFILPFGENHYIHFQDNQGNWSFDYYSNVVRYKEIKRIQYNSKKVKNFFIVDIDNSQNVDLYLNKNIPTPNMIIRNRGSFGVHLVWVLDFPIWETDTKRTVQWERISKSLSHACGGDKQFTHHIGKNFHNSIDFEITFTDTENYSLNDFKNITTTQPSEGYINTQVRKKSLSRPSIGQVSEKIEVGNRNLGLFNKIRKFSYQELHHHFTNKSFEDSIFRYSHDLNQSIKEPLDDKEVNRIAKSIVKYCLTHKTKILTKKKERGKMNLDENITLKEKQKLSSQYAAKVKTEKTRLKIKISILEMKKKEMKINVSSVSKYSKLSRPTITKNKDLLV